MKNHRRGNYRSGSRGSWGSLRATRVLAKDELRLLLLSLIDATERHGYELIRQIKSLSLGAYAPSSGMVYPALAELAEAGLAVQSDGRGGRKLYVSTDAGLAEAKAKATDIISVRKRLKELGSAEYVEPDAIRRARANFDMVLSNVLEGGEQGIVDEIVDLIDQAARQIERLGK